MTEQRRLAANRPSGPWRSNLSSETPSAFNPSPAMMGSSSLRVPLLLRPQPLEALDKLADRRRLGRP
jgi:hypothetical protein